MKTLAPLFLGVLLTTACSGSNFASSGSGKADSKKASKEKKEEVEPTDDDSKDDVDANKNADDDPELDEAANTESKAGEEDEEAACNKKGKPGYAGDVYQLPEDTDELPNFKALTPVGQLEALELNVAPRDFTAGFPGVENLKEWFGILFKASLVVPEDGSYEFRTNSDDGSIVYLDGAKVVENDGEHGPRERTGDPVTLKKGDRAIEIHWFQGPATQIALQVFWKKPGANAFEIIPATVLKHDLDCKLKDLGDFQ